MNKRQENDARECEALDEQGESKDCSSCSCSICLAEEATLTHNAAVGEAYQWAYEGGVLSISPESLVSQFKKERDRL